MVKEKNKKLFSFIDLSSPPLSNANNIITSLLLRTNPHNEKNHRKQIWIHEKQIGDYLKRTMNIESMIMTLMLGPFAFHGGVCYRNVRRYTVGVKNPVDDGYEAHDFATTKDLEVCRRICCNCDMRFIFLFWFLLFFMF